MLLGHIEDHSRRLRDQIGQLRTTYESLEKTGSQGGRQQAELQTELGQVRREIVSAERDLADARQAAAARQPSYAIIPFEGPNQTHRRPMYIECTPQAIILQPEGVTLTVDDFEGPMGPGNPLAAAMRAAREYLLMHGGFDPATSGEPYPLLVVRPGGIIAFYEARAAMKSWATDFGYELVNDDWKLQYQKPDAELARVVRRALDSARQQQAQLIAAAPRSYDNGRHGAYRVSPSHGGLIRDDADSTEDADTGGFHPSRPAGRIAASFGASGDGGAQDPGTPSPKPAAGDLNAIYGAAANKPSLGSPYGGSMANASAFGYGSGNAGYGNLAANGPGSGSGSAYGPGTGAVAGGPGFAPGGSGAVRVIQFPVRLVPVRSTARRRAVPVARALVQVVQLPVKVVLARCSGHRAVRAVLVRCTAWCPPVRSFRPRNWLGNEWFRHNGRQGVPPAHERSDCRPIRRWRARPLPAEQRRPKAFWHLGQLPSGRRRHLPPIKKNRRPARRRWRCGRGEWYPTEPAPEKPKDDDPDKPEKRNRGHKPIERKRDWGLPEGRAGSVGLTRSIHVECEADRLTIIPRTRSGRRQDHPAWPAYRGRRATNS